MLKINSQWLYPALVLSMLVWGIAWPSAKVLSAYSNPIHIAAIRFSFTAVGIYILLKIIKVDLTINRKGWQWLFLGGLLMASYSYLFFTGIKFGLPGEGGILVTTMTPIVSYLISLMIQKRAPNRLEALALFVGLIAAFFLLHVWTHAGEIFKSANILFLLSCVVWAFLSRITANAAQYGSPLAFTWWMYVFCAIVLSFLNPWSLTVDLLQHKADAKFYWNMVFNGVINTGIATTIFFFVTSKIGAAKTSMFIYIVPFAAAISSALLLGEVLHWYSIVGGALGISAVLIINARRWVK